jgi:excisionase family DNA binding protein|tara:strand:+ start:819 stop:1034 length:216 start_codon:yes stop_codon:yes gene_type:complete
MTPKEAAELANVSLSHMGYLLKNGTIKSTKLGRFYNVNRASLLNYAKDEYVSGFPRGKKRSSERGSISNKK